MMDPYDPYERCSVSPDDILLFCFINSFKEQLVMTMPDRYSLGIGVLPSQRKSLAEDHHITQDHTYEMNQHQGPEN